jgi:hypothetical protein
MLKDGAANGRIWRCQCQKMVLPMIEDDAVSGQRWCCLWKKMVLPMVEDGGAYGTVEDSAANGRRG